jgi:hypothetical protein
MAVLKPSNVGCDGGHAGLDSPVVAIHGRVACLARGIIEKHADSGVRGLLVAFQRQRVIAALIDNVPGSVTQAVKRVHGHDRVLE